ERYDGKGYPYGIEKKKIPLIATIISLADAFDAMTTDRPYRKAYSFTEAIKEIKKNRKKQFSPKVVDAFLSDLSKIKKIFSDHLVSLNNSFQN
ncbi:MAG: two-component system response regulator, partial [Candidatus Omnitrophica bacterium]|nr:two-component system response regulator [Candidatus Omnitrophota bacterium]